MSTNPLYFDKIKSIKARIPSGASILYTTVIFVLASTFGAIGAGTLWFHQNYYLANPVKVTIDCLACQRPTPTPQVILVTPTATPTPSAPKSKTDLVKSARYSGLIDHIWLRESGRGSNHGGIQGTCEARGMSNEFGFYPSGGWCFDTFEEGVRRLERWMDENADLTDNQKLCKYNSGQAVDMCAYLSYNFAEMN